MKYKQIPMNDMTMTYMEEADTQLEAMLNSRAEAAAKAHTTAHRTAIRRLTRPVVILWVLTALVWLANALYAAGALTLIQCEIAQGALLVGVLISAVVVTVRVMGGVAE